jgi:8-oxo-dGTP pyrophosphatase MutT (NUDIX family)
VATHSLDVLARLRPQVPAALVAKVEAWPAGASPARPRRSASVVLVRSGAPRRGDRLEVYLLHRHSRMAFAPSMVVFPGGGLDPGDGGPDPVRACAVRETREETGVSLQVGSLHDWAHWVTPEVEPRRFDTRFFLAVLPNDQQARDLSGETDTAGWMTPSDALAAADRGEIGLMPPTLSILTELAEAVTVEAALLMAADRVVVTVRPRIERDARGWHFVYPRPEQSG